MNKSEEVARRIDPRDLVLAVVAARGTVPGRTVLQKISYFLNTALDLRIGFKPYFYGPYSEELAVATDSLVGYGFLEEESLPLSVVKEDESDFDSRQYKYSLTARGKKLVEIRKEKIAEYKLIGEKISELKKSGLDLQSASFLAAVAKITFIVMRENRRLSRNEISAIARDLGWKLSPQQIEQLLKFLTMANGPKALQVSA